MEKTKKEEMLLSNIPDSPWVYLFKNKEEEIIYIGKSVALKKRVASYFNGKAKLNFGKKKMVSEIEKIDTFLVNNETESLILESTLIKKHQPKYNILMKDDKNYVYVKITTEIIPRILITRKKTLWWTYFWPYISASNVKNTLKILKKIFGYRSCNIVFKKDSRTQKLVISAKNGVKIPCIDYYIGRCKAPCLLNEENKKAYQESIEKIKDFFAWDTKAILEQIEKSMLKKAQEHKFEEAWELKKDKEAIESLAGTQIVRDFVEGDFDVINILEKYDKYFIGVVEIRKSKITWLKNFEIIASLWEKKEEVLESFLMQRETKIPETKKLTLLLPFSLDKIEKKEKSLQEILGVKKLTIETPKIGAKQELLKFVYKNIYEYAYKKQLASLSTKNFSKKTQESLLKRLGYTPLYKQTKSSQKQGLQEKNLSDDEVLHFSEKLQPWNSQKQEVQGRKNFSNWAYWLVSDWEQDFSDDEIPRFSEFHKDIIFECNDISHLSWNHSVASRSVIKNGKPEKSLYRKFNIKTLPEQKIDDFDSLEEVIERRLKEIENKENLPDLIIIDGGKWQLSSVMKVIESYKKNCDKKTKTLLDKLQIISLAKREEEVFLPWKSDPIILDKDSEELRLIQKIRDEAHRFAITFNREKRIKSMQKNILESLPWFWPITRKKLLKKYGSVENLKDTPKEELEKILNKNQIETLEDHSLI